MSKLLFDWFVLIQRIRKVNTDDATVLKSQFLYSLRTFCSVTEIGKRICLRCLSFFTYDIFSDKSHKLMKIVLRPFCSYFILVDSAKNINKSNPITEKVHVHPTCFMNAIKTCLFPFFYTFSEHRKSKNDISAVIRTYRSTYTCCKCPIDI
jgi:hypothetical protein